MTFSDDFERADGPLGANWYVYNGNVAISGGKLRSSGGSFYQPTANTVGPDFDITMVASAESGALRLPSLYPRAASGNGHYWAVPSWGSLSGFQWSIAYWTGATWQNFGIYNLAGGPGTTATYRLSLVGDTFTFWINGSQVGQVSDTHWATGDEYFLGDDGPEAWLDSFQEGVVVTRELTVTPDPAWVGGGNLAMVATGTNTEWTAGVPGSSTITVDHGTIDDQWTEDETTIHFTLAPAEYVGTLTFTESEYSLTDEVQSTLTPPEGGGTGECPFNDEFVEVANRTGLLDSEAALLTNTTVAFAPGGGAADTSVVDAIGALYRAEFITDIGPPTEPSLAYWIWQILNGSNDPPTGPFLAPSSIPVAQHLDGITTALSNLTGEGAWTLALLLGELAGPLGTNLSDLEADLGVHTQMAYASVIDAINVTRGPEMPTLTAILSAIEAINPGGTTDLTAVMALLNFITSDGVVNLNSVLSTLATMRGDNSSTLHAIQAYCVTAIAKLDEIKTYLQDQLGPMTVTLAAIEAKVDQILALLQQIAVTRFQPPVWPGLANVDLYAMYSLPGHINLPGPMHGVRITITSTDPGTGFYDYDTHRCWRNIGALAFVTEDGYAEMWQPLGFTNAIYVPKTMTIAGSVIAHLGRGPQGFIQPWTFKEG